MPNKAVHRTPWLAPVTFDPRAAGVVANRDRRQSILHHRDHGRRAEAKMHK
jgi:hypothetical protein